MVAITGRVVGTAAATAALKSSDEKLYAAMAVGMSDGINRGEAIVRGNASGRPGPNVISGAHRAGINGEIISTGQVVSGQIGASSAQAARLEFGFVGPDALGRVYNQPPFPYFEPSVPGVTDACVSAVTGAVLAVF